MVGKCTPICETVATKVVCDSTVHMELGADCPDKAAKTSIAHFSVAHILYCILSALTYIAAMSVI